MAHAILMLHGANAVIARELVTSDGIDASSLEIGSSGTLLTIFMPYHIAKAMADAYESACAASNEVEAA